MPVVLEPLHWTELPALIAQKGNMGIVVYAISVNQGSMLQVVAWTYVSPVHQAQWHLTTDQQLAHPVAKEHLALERLQTVQHAQQGIMPLEPWSQVARHAVLDQALVNNLAHLSAFPALQVPIQANTVPQVAPSVTPVHTALIPPCIAQSALPEPFRGGMLLNAPTAPTIQWLHHMHRLLVQVATTDMKE